MSSLRPMRVAQKTAPAVCVLFVDDHAETVEAFAGYFRHSGLTVHTAVTGPEAVRLARALSPDVVVLDLSLPAMDGIEVMDVLRGSDETALAPIVVFSGAEAERYPRHRANAWVMKPCQPSDLLSVVQKMAEKAIA
jgi:CheY-like chemotaxis protein